MIQANGAAFIEEIPNIKVKVLEVNPQARDGILEALSHNPAVEFAEKNGIAEAAATPNDPSFNLQYGMTKVQAPQAWDTTIGSSTIPVAILDTGVESTHQDLTGKVLFSVNFTGSTTGTNDIYGHGTHVAGISAASTNNSLGVAGLGYNSSLMNVKVMGDTGWGSYSWIANGITWAADNGAKVINMSLGGSSASTALEDAVNYAWNKGVVVVAAAGNSGNSSLFYPAFYSNVIAVAATDNVDQLASFSTRGDWVDVAAPGVTIYSTTINSTYGYNSGTSMASPHVAGLAALVFTKVSDTNGNGLLNDEVRNCIQTYADPITATGVGSGRINAYKAVLCSPITLTPTPTLGPIPTPTPTPTPILSDPTPPTTSIASPLNGSIVVKKAIATINANASDNIAVSKVEFYVNGSLKCSISTSSYSCPWRVPAASNKTYQLQTKAYDAANNIGSSSIVTVTVK